MKKEHIERIYSSLNRYIRFTLKREITMVKDEGNEFLNNVKIFKNNENIKDYYLILSLFKNNIEEQEHSFHDNQLMSIDFVINRNRGIKVRIDWSLENPLSDLLENIKSIQEKLENKKQIKFIILG